MCESAKNVLICVFSCLIFVDLTILQFGLALLLKGDDNEGHEDVDKEEWEDDKEDDVENGHLHPEPRDGALVLVRRGHGVLEHTNLRKELRKE